MMLAVSKSVAVTVAIVLHLGGAELAVSLVFDLHDSISSKWECQEVHSQSGLKENQFTQRESTYSSSKIRFRFVYDNMRLTVPQIDSLRAVCGGSVFVCVRALRRRIAKLPCFLSVGILLSSTCPKEAGNA